MSATTLSALVLASTNKHHVLGLVAIIVGAVVVLFGGIRAAGKVAGAMIFPILGLAVVVLGILAYAHVI